MDSNFMATRTLEASTRCEAGLRLRRRLLKLRWMGLESEADQIANEILRLERDISPSLAPRISATD
jgi:hypothetical protein